MMQAQFLEYLEHSVVHIHYCNILPHSLFVQLPLCTPFPGYLSVLIMDNAHIHHGKEILELMQRFGNTMALTLEIICLLLNFRCPSQVSSILLTWLQSYWGSLLESQSIHSPPWKFTYAWRQWDAIWLDGVYGSHNTIRCSWVLHTCRILLEHYNEQVTVQLQHVH